MTVLILVLLPIGRLFCAESEAGGSVGYISGNTVYIDAGSADGISVGDTVDVTRGETPVGKMVIVNTATNASSCEPLFPIENVRIGDRVVTSAEVQPGEEVAQTPVTKETTRPKRKNRLRGRIALGSLLSEDLTDSGLDFSQPTLSTRIGVNDIAGKSLQLRLRHRSRYYGRERSLTTGASRERWTHQVFELALEYAGDESPYRIQLGRLLPKAPRGLGYIDGALVEYKPRDRLSLGVTGGTRPDLLNAGFESDNATFGVFARSEYAVGGTGKASFSAAFVGNYRSGSVNREFLTLEGDYYTSSRLSTSGSLEIDMNRGWRASGEDLLELTSMYLTARYRLNADLSANVSYDTRRSPRTLDTRSIPDSIFDDSYRKGLHTGVSWSMSPRVRMSGNFGVRFREDVDNTISASGTIRIREFPMIGMTTNGRFQLFRNMFSRGYRPTVGFAMSPIRDLMVNLRFGDSIYDIGGEVTHSPMVGSSLNYWLSRRRFLAVSFNGYLSERNRSLQLFGETGILF